MWSAEKKQAFKRSYVDLRGYWAEFNDGLLEHCPDWLEAYLGYSSTPARTGPLSARMRELIYIAVDGSTTHLFRAGLEIHIAIALDAGCSAGELVEVLQMAAMQGLDSVALGMTILQEELAARGGPLAVAEPSPPAGSEAALRRYAAAAGGAPDWIALMARLSPEWLEALAALLETAERGSALNRREKALIRLALAASPTHLDPGAVRAALREALDGDVPLAEIAEVFQLVAHLGLHACSEGVPAIQRADARRRAAAGRGDRP